MALYERLRVERRDERLCVLRGGEAEVALKGQGEDARMHGREMNTCSISVQVRGHVCADVETKLTEVMPLL